MLRWAARLPAWARVVPRAERKMEGGGERVERWVGQVEVSVEVTGWILECGSGVDGARRARAVTVVMEERFRRVERIWDPCLVVIIAS